MTDKSTVTGRLLVFREKHGDLYYDATTDEMAQAAMIQVVNRRFADGHWYRSLKPAGM